MVKFFQQNSISMAEAVHQFNYFDVALSILMLISSKNFYGNVIIVLINVCY